jgi:ABC-type anion transport system duplicated permease subunit
MQNLHRKTIYFFFEKIMWTIFVCDLISTTFFFISVHNTTAMGITGIRVGGILVMLIAQGCFTHGDSFKF